MYNEPDGKYCYKDSNILINKLNIKNYSLLDETERVIVALKLYELGKRKVIDNVDLECFKNIHKYLFEDIYDFAGKFRNVNIAKGSFKFAEYQFVEQEIERLFEKLKNENYLKDLSKEELSKRLSYYLSELNVLHPFREGNGRAIREFIRQLAIGTGHELNWANTIHDAILKTTIISVVHNEELEKVILKCLS